jgi:hypothetical protein
VHVGFCQGNLKERRCLEDINVGRRIILIKWILKE